MNRKVVLTFFMSVLLLLVALGTSFVAPVATDPITAEPIYVGIAEYYDNRKCVVTSTVDEFFLAKNSMEQCLNMYTKKKIYHTVATVTNRTPEWSFAQYWLDRGYTEVASHSRNHVHAPYEGSPDPYNGKPKMSYEWQINRSKNDIIGNLTLPIWWRYGEKEYVYAWIEPFGSCDDKVREWLGYCYYLCDRSASTGIYNFAGWDYTKGLFHRVGYTVEIGNPPWGGDTNIISLNGKFDKACSEGRIYHFVCHPWHVNWTEGSYADQHTDYISNRTDVWYVPFGLLYLYRWVAIRNIVNITSTGSGQNKIFKLSINETDHQNYGVSYPITYVFNIPPNWTDAYVYHRYVKTDPWTLMENKSSEDFFNGITASRFNFTNHKAHVSTSFSNLSHEIHLQLRNTTIPPPSPPVGGIYIPVDKLRLLTPYARLTILLVVAVATVTYVKKRKERHRD